MPAPVLASETVPVPSSRIWPANVPSASPAPTVSVDVELASVLVIVPPLPERLPTVSLSPFKSSVPPSIVDRGVASDLLVAGAGKLHRAAVDRQCIVDGVNRRVARFVEFHDAVVHDQIQADVVAAAAEDERIRAGLGERSEAVFVDRAAQRDIAGAGNDETWGDAKRIVVDQAGERGGGVCRCS